MLNVVPLKLHVPVLAAMPCLFIQERRVKTGRRGGGQGSHPLVLFIAEETTNMVLQLLLFLYLTTL